MGTDDVESWEIGADRRTLLRVTPAGFPVLLVVGLFVLTSTVRGASPPVAIAVYAVWVAACGYVASIVLRGVTRLTLHPDGTLVAERPIGTVRTRVDHVTRVGWSARTGPHGRRWATIRTTDGTLSLTGGFPDVGRVARTLRARHAGVVVDL